MKNKSILLLVLFSRMVLSQTYNLAYTAGTESTYNMVGINSKSFYLEKSLKIPHCCHDELSLVGMAPNGKFMFRTLILVEPWVQDCHVTVTADKQLLAYAGTDVQGCDVGGQLYKILKIDTTGNTIFAITLTMRVDQLLARPDSTFDLISNNTLYHYNVSGQLISNTPLGISSIQSAINLTGGSTLFSYSGTTPRLRVVHASGSVVLDVVAQSTLTSMVQAPDGSILGISGGQIQKYSSSLTLAYTSATAIPSQFSFSAFVWRHDSIFAVGDSGAIRPAYFILDSTLTELYRTSSNAEGPKCTGIFVGNNNRVNVITWSQPTPYASHGFTGFFQLSRTGIMNVNNDIGVKRVVIDSSIYLANFTPWKIVVVNASVTVRNYGNNRVKSFHLNHYTMVTGISYCLMGLNRLYTIDIPPGDSVTVNTGTFYVKGALTSSSTVQYQLCISTSVPDSLNDENISNDQSCSAVLQLPVGLNEKADNVTAIRIFPNPSEGVLTITAPSKLTRIEVYDLGGRLVRSVETNGREFVLNDNTLKGLYLFRVISEDGILTKRVVLN